MKTKTTLAALLLAAVMVTPSSGAGKAFLTGAKKSLTTTNADWNTGYFRGYFDAVFHSGQVNVPVGATNGQLYTVVARYIDEHPEHHHLPETELVKRACKEAWPDLNKHVVISK